MPEPFFLYQEDVDLSLRLRLAGGTIGIEPAARVDHDYEFAKGPAKWRYLERNRWAMILRTYPLALLLLLTPALLATEIALFAIAHRRRLGAPEGARQARPDPLAAAPAARAPTRSRRPGAIARRPSSPAT